MIGFECGGPAYHLHMFLKHIASDAGRIISDSERLMVQILLAESDRRIGQFIAGILTDFGHDVTTCQDCTEAAALLAIGPIDVLVTDLVLRDSEGSTLSRHCAARGIPTITLTGHEFHIGQAAQDRPPPLFEKPFRFDDLQSVLDAVALYSGSTRAAA
jgi:DNA-binding NtrC family response regulator